MTYNLGGVYSNPSSPYQFSNAPQGWVALTSASQDGTSTGSTTPAAVTTGANFIVLGAGSYNQAPIVSDSAGNTWTALNLATGDPCECQLFYCINPTTSAAHTFTVAGAFAPIVMGAFKNPAPAFDQQSTGFQSSGATIQPGSVTPAHAGELIITVEADLGQTPGTRTINSGMTLVAQLAAGIGVSVGFAMAYLIQGAAAAINPTWTINGPVDGTAAIATFS